MAKGFTQKQQKKGALVTAEKHHHSAFLVVFVFARGKHQSKKEYSPDKVARIVAVVYRNWFADL